MKEKGKKTGLFGIVITKFVGGFAVIALVLFLPAGTVAYWNAWLFMGVLILLMTATLTYFFRNDPDLLRKRMQFREKRQEQKTYVKISTVVLCLGFLLPGFDYRFQWSSVPLWLVMAGTVVMIAGYVIFFLVLRQNSYASRVIEIQKKQKLIDTGLYSVVRHPMYLSTTLIYLSMPLVLGSYFAYIPMVLFVALMPIRILNEEKMLEKGLKGYRQYEKKVKYRIIPFIW